MTKTTSLRKGRMASAPTIFLLFTFYFLLSTFSFAQLATGTNPEQVADEAVRAWLETEQPTLASLANRPAEEVCEELPALINNLAPPAGTKVVFDNRREQASDDPNLKRFTYPASIPISALGRTAERLEVIEVSLSKTGTSWQADRVTFQQTLQPSGIRVWLQTPTASYLFVAFSILVVYLLVRPTSFLRKWLARGREAIAAHRGLVIGTMIALYAVFGLGAFTGSQLPTSCREAVQEVVTTAVTMLGAADAYNSRDVSRAAVVTFYQNFGMVTLSFLFGSALLLGIPAYLVSALSFFVQGIPFGLLGGGSTGEVIFVIILLVLELTSYFLVVAGGGMLLVTVVRKGFRGFGEGVRKLALMLPFAMLLLLLGAWYEAGIIILPQLLGR